ncbi:hypothetical protein ACWGKQ_31835 [Streptomyces sp. NPDC054770]
MNDSPTEAGEPAGYGCRKAPGPTVPTRAAGGGRRHPRAAARRRGPRGAAVPVRGRRRCLPAGTTAGRALAGPAGRLCLASTVASPATVARPGESRPHLGTNLLEGDPVKPFRPRTRPAGPAPTPRTEERKAS